jgi:hypothetical protein
MTDSTYTEKKGKVFIKTIERETTQNVHEFQNKGNRGMSKMNKTKVGIRPKDGVMASYNVAKGKLQTGLDVYYDNPFKGDNPKYTLPAGFPDSFKTADKVLLQHIMEAKHGVTFNFYTDAPPTSGYKDPKDLTFYQKFRYKWSDGSTVLDMNKPHDELAYFIVISNPKKYAPNYEAYRQHKHPFATHYIFMEEEHQELELSKKKIKNKAIALLDDLSTTKQDFLVVLVKCIKKQVGGINPSQAYTLIDDYVNTTTNKAVTNAEVFINLVKKAETPQGKIELNSMALLQDLIFYKVVTSRQDVYTWLSRSIVIGFRESDAVEFLSDPNKGPERTDMENELKAKMLK